MKNKLSSSQRKDECFLESTLDYAQVQTESADSLQDLDSFTVILDFSFLNTWKDKNKKCSKSYLVFDDSDSPRMASQTHSHTETLKKIFSRDLN